MFKLSIALAAAAAYAAPTLHTNSSSYNLAVAGLQLATIDFVSAVSYDDQPMNGYSEAGVTFNSSSGYLYGRTYNGSFIYGPPGSNYIRVLLPAGTTGVAFDYRQSYSTGHPTDFLLASGDTFTLSATSGFMGFTDSNPIQYVDVRVQTGAPRYPYDLTSDYPELLNVYRAVDPSQIADTPEPGTFALLAGPLLFLLHARRRRNTV